MCGLAPSSAARQSRPLAFVMMLGLLTATVRAQPGPTAVQTAAVEQSAMRRTVTLVGTVRPDRRSAVAAEVAGYVSELPIEPGDRVAKGDVLCRLRADTREMVVAETEGRLEQLRAAALEAEAMVRKWEFERDRIAGLWDSRRSSEKELRDAESEFAAAKARQQAAAAGVIATEALVRRVRDELERCTIVAPFDGVVVERRTELGQWVVQGGEVAVLIAMDPARVRVNAPESCVVFAEVGEPVSARIDALSNVFVGRLARISPDGDEQARTFPAEIEIPNPDGRIRAGMFARVEFPAGAKEPRLTVPKDAIVRREVGPMLFVVRDPGGTAMAVPQAVDIIGESGDRYAVASPGLAVGDRVVVRGNERMFAPTPVIPMPSADTQPAGSAVESSARRPT